MANLFEPVAHPAIDRFAAELVKQSRIGKLSFAVRRSDVDATISDAETIQVLIARFVLELDCTGHVFVWLRIPRPEALGILTGALAVDLCYHYHRLDWSTAEILAIEFLHLFPDDSSYFTNLGALELNARFAKGPEYESGSPMWRGWNPVQSVDSVDTGIIVAGRNRIGILWVQDQD